jgi:uncharacterized protein (DUF1697 family)
MPSQAYVALLRGINLAGKNRVPMRPLVPLLEDLGCSGVTPYIQSGNLVFRASAKAADKLPERLQAAIAERFGVHSPVVLRSARELQAVALTNPFLAKGADPTALHVLFLADRPTAARVSALDPERSPGDAFVVRGREVYYLCPNGVGRSKLTTAYFDNKLGTVGTLRNWRTVCKLIELSSDA